MSNKKHGAGHVHKDAAGRGHGHTLKHGYDHDSAHIHEQGHEHEHHHEHGHENSHGHDHHHEHKQDHSHGHDHDHSHSYEHHPVAPVSSGTVLTVRPTSGLSGDIMLAGLASLAGLSNTELNALVEELHMPALKDCLNLQARAINHIAGVGCQVNLPHEHAHRTLTDIIQIIDVSAMPENAKTLAKRAFTVLAEAEAAVHDKNLSDVTFHEVGALDSIVDTCMVCRIFTLLDPTLFVCGPLPLADGVINCAHGLVPSPAPAVLRLLEGIPVRSFAGQGETVTPTAMALLKALGANFGPWPTMRVAKTCISYGTKVFTNAPNGAVWALGSV